MFKLNPFNLRQIILTFHFSFINLYSVTNALNDWSWINNEYKNPCPSVYVYDTGPEYYGYHGFNYTTYMTHGIKNPFGPECKEHKGTHLTHMYELLRITLYRLYHSKRCHLVKDPKKAKLFLIPMYPGIYQGREWQKLCDIHKNASIPHLPYLTEETAPFHFFVVSLIHFVACEEWFRYPKKDSLLSQATRISYEMSYLVTNHSLGIPGLGPYEGTLEIKNLTEDKVYAPHAVSVPYPSSIHWSHTFNPSLKHLWHHDNRNKHYCKRKYLVSFAGKFRYCNYGHIRPYLEKVFQNCPKDICTFWNFTKGTDCELLNPKLNSIFCLEPGGDGPTRRSLYDSILSGCIPVVFNDYHLLTSPWHWGPFAKNASVYIDENKIMSGEIDLIQYLQAIPQEQIKAMQHTISKYGHRIQYALDDYRNDAFEIMLKGIYRYGMMRRPKDNNTIV